jgi:2-oxoglutarate dehydrogenase E1 component
MPKLSSALPSESAVRQNTKSAGAASASPLPSAAGALIDAYRAHGYRRASIDPLGIVPGNPSIAELEPQAYALPRDSSIAYALDFGGDSHVLTLSALIDLLREAYCGTVAIDCAHVRSAEQRRWLYTRMEARSGWPDPLGDDWRRILGQLVAAEAFEQFHRMNFPAYKQFGLEGSESIVTLLREAIEGAADHGVEAVVLGMPHRGRLNMMLNALDVPAQKLLSLFSVNPDGELAARDLKDHAGRSGRITTGSGEIGILLAHNPSHLESVSPVVCGMARALQDRQADASTRKVMPLLVHGDASFSAQGIVTETLNLSQTRGYGVGGTLHLILNNQIGSTVSHPRDSRSTLSCADVARAVDAPIVHVNADDPDAVVFAARLATGFRTTFGADIVVDHVGYRRHGHFVRDDPTITQPAMQRLIRRHRGVVSLYAEDLSRRGIAGGEALAEALGAEALTALKAGAPGSGDSTTTGGSDPRVPRSPEPPRNKQVRTPVPLSQLRAMTERLAAAPQNFVLHPDLSRMLDDWRSIAGGEDRPVDWRLAENLAYGSVLANGFNVRLSGLDIGRGTFVHRQHVWHDQDADTDWQDLHVPLRHVADGQGIFSIFESPLSEEAVVGFEYGYSLKCGRDLVLWEAQFGDFVNNAQVLIDQYIASGEAKWGYESGLVLLLPHGHDGWGPEHSCAFLGRFLQLCASDNMHVAMPSTAAQMFHLLRRQALTERRRPLIVMTPKPWLYAVRPSYSRLSDLADDEFRPLLAEAHGIDVEAVRRVIVTSGKLYYDLAEERAKTGGRDVPIVRVEEIYPFPADALAAELRRFPRLTHAVWAQEEARNHGAWHFVREAVERALPPGVSLDYVGRSASAASATGSAAVHAVEQRQIVAAALEHPRG